MTAKEAITLLSQLSAGIEGVLDMHYAEAIDMAIEALKAQEKTDPISHQGAIDALMEEFKRIPTTAIRAKNIIEGLPSAQPEPPKREISYRDCCYAMLKMWIVGVLTDGEYYKIMDKLNEHEDARWRTDG